jgi:multiple sugar transport system ATP-binding protein
LSGGQRQRVAIGRAIVRNPKVFLFDEPLSNLDAALRVRMRQGLTKLHRQLHATMIYVTHDQVEAMTMADRIVVLRAGVVEQVGSPMELYHRPKNQFVAGFIGSPRMNFLEAVVQEKSPDGSIVALPGGFVIKARVTDTGGAAGDPVTLGIRPEHLTIVPEGGWNAKVQTVENLGSESYIHVQINDGQAITVRINGAAEVRPDQMVQLQLNLQHLHVFDQEGRSISPLP